MKISPYHVANLKLIKALDPTVRGLFYEFIMRIAMANIYIRITSGMRTKEEQDAEYAKGRTAPGKIVTWVNDHDSYHTWGLAIDIAPLTVLGPLAFKAIYSKDAYAQLDRIAREIGLEHPYTFDLPHFQYTGGKTTIMLKKGEAIPPPPSVIPQESAERARLEERLRMQGVLPI